MKRKHDDDGTTTGSRINNNNNSNDYREQLIRDTLYRLTSGIPRRELKLMLQEIDECEKLLQEDIYVLENALKNNNSTKDKHDGDDNFKNDDQKQPKKKKQKAIDLPVEEQTKILQSILEAPLSTPLDRFWTASALVGRLRREMAIPSTIMSSPYDHEDGPADETTITKKEDNSMMTTEFEAKEVSYPAMTANNNPSALNHVSVNPSTGQNNIQANNTNDNAEIQLGEELLELEKNEIYKHDIRLVNVNNNNNSNNSSNNNNANSNNNNSNNNSNMTAQPQLLTLWKKISNHKYSLVFKRPVKVEEAPGYNDRILFPMDLSSIRKLIVTNKIYTFQQLHDKIRLICHNCVKYNGRDSDYGRVARDFECMADEYIKQAVHNLQATIPSTAATATTLVYNKNTAATTTNTTSTSTVVTLATKPNPLSERNVAKATNLATAPATEVTSTTATTTSSNVPSS